MARDLAQATADRRNSPALLVKFHLINGISYYDFLKNMEEVQHYAEGDNVQHVEVIEEIQPKEETE